MNNCTFALLLLLVVVIVLPLEKENIVIHSFYYRLNSTLNCFCTCNILNQRYQGIFELNRSKQLTTWEWKCIDKKTSFMIIIWISKRLPFSLIQIRKKMSYAHAQRLQMWVWVLVFVFFTCLIFNTECIKNAGTRQWKEHKYLERGWLENTMNYWSTRK